MWTPGWGLGVHSELSDGHMTWVLAFQVVGISDIFSCTYDLFRNKVESPQPCSFLPLEMYFPPGPHPPPRWFEVGAAWSYRRQQPLSWRNGIASLASLLKTRHTSRCFPFLGCLERNSATMKSGSGAAHGLSGTLSIF